MLYQLSYPLGSAARGWMRIRGSAELPHSVAFGGEDRQTEQRTRPTIARSKSRCPRRESPRIFCPGGASDSSPAFQRRVRVVFITQVPSGRLNTEHAKSASHPSRRDSLIAGAHEPGTSVPGYCQHLPSRRRTKSSSFSHRNLAALRSACTDRSSL